jgi:Holliday junction resolvase RusA-like endonuclease
MSVVIVFDDLPYVELRANYHKSNFWGERAEATKLAKKEALLLGLQYINSHSDFKTIDVCTVEEVFTVDNNIRRDVENLIFAGKAFIDGIVSAGVITDDSWHHVRKLSGRIVYKKGCRQTEIIITEVLE